jgi:hypothetical protein
MLPCFLQEFVTHKLCRRSQTAEPILDVAPHTEGLRAIITDSHITVLNSRLALPTAARQLTNECQCA